MDWIITYDHYCEAVEKVYGAVMDYLPRPIPCLPMSEVKEDDLYSISLIYVGTHKSYPAPINGYRIKAQKMPWGNQQIFVLAQDDVNLLYAAFDFETQFLTFLHHTDEIVGSGYYFRNPFDHIPDYDKSFSPSIKNRGIWTWGHVIYDYRRFIENMARLKLNMLIVWNDFPPINAEQMIEYAHRFGIKIIWGFAWGWDTDCTRAALEDMDDLRQSILKTYRQSYAPLGGDGIYFQSFTEVDREEINGVPVAETVTRLVNRTAAELLDENPALVIQFGLHATSVKNRLDVIKMVDSRVDILWEDCGAFPYHYIPRNVQDFGETALFTDRLLTLRRKSFGAVLKGLTALDWSQFAHQTGYGIVGTYSERFIKRRTEEKKAIWRYVQAYWIRNAGYAYDVIKRFGAEDTIAALVEDGMFEEVIPYPVALYAAMLWDNQQPFEDMIATTALRPDVTFM